MLLHRLQGYDQSADGLADWPSRPPLAVQQSVDVTGTILAPVSASGKSGTVHGAPPFHAGVALVHATCAA